MSFTEPEVERTGTYVADHWRGNLPLPLSYWINGSLVAGLTLALTGLARSRIEQGDTSLRLASAGVLGLMLLGLVVWLWSAVGIWRSAGRHVGRGGSAFWAFAARAMVVLGALNTAAQLVSLSPVVAEFSQIAAGDDPIGAKANLVVSGDTLALTGWIAAGTADEVAKALDTHPSVRRVALQSSGGRIRDARQIAATMVRHKLDTVATGECASSCTIIFLAGARRYAEVGASLGFHSPSAVGMNDSEAQRASPDMRAAYERAGLPPAFIAKALNTPSGSLWHPTELELVDAGVINHFSPDRIAANNKQIASELAKAGPRRIDQVTTLAGATASGTGLTYRYKVDAPAARIDARILAGIGRQARDDLCASRVDSLMIRSGASYAYQYRDNAGRLIGQYAVSDCPDGRSRDSR